MDGRAWMATSNWENIEFGVASSGKILRWHQVAPAGNEVIQVLSSLLERSTVSPRKRQAILHHFENLCVARHCSRQYSSTAMPTCRARAAAYPRMIDPGVSSVML